MGRLIDADDIEFKKKFCKRFCTNLADVTTCERKENCGIMEWIDEQPTAYDVDGVISQLENKMFSAECYNDDFNGCEIGNLLCMGDVYEIVKGAVKVE